MQTVATDHAPFDFRKQKEMGKNDFTKIPNGIPGIETRLPLLFDGVSKGRITLQQFVALTATNQARIYGLSGRKGAIAIGADADLALWDPDREVTIRNDDLHHAVDYTPYEGMTLAAWPALTLAGGEVVWDGADFHPRAGRGRFLRCGAPTLRPRTR